MNISEVEEKLSAARANQATLKSQLDESAESLAKKKDEYESAVRTGADEATLDKMDAEIFKSERARVRLEIKLNQCGAEIEQLFHDREQAHAEDARGAYAADVIAALSEAREIEAAVQLLMGSVAVHAKRLEKMRQYAESVGAAHVPFRIKNLERRVSTIFADNQSLYKDFKKPYPEILAGNVESVERQIKRTAPASEEVAEHEAEQVAVNN